MIYELEVVPKSEAIYELEIVSKYEGIFEVEVVSGFEGIFGINELNVVAKSDLRDIQVRSSTHVWIKKYSRVIGRCGYTKKKYINKQTNKQTATTIQI